MDTRTTISRRALRFVLVGILAVGLLAGVACTEETGDPADTAEPAAQEPDTPGMVDEDDIDEGPPVSDDAEEPVADRSEGDLLVDEICTRCHSRTRVDMVAGRDRAGWEQTVERMIRNGASMTDAEKATIIDYLSGE
jgi:cytochrome c5